MGATGVQLKAPGEKSRVWGALCSCEAKAPVGGEGTVVTWARWDPYSRPHKKGSEEPGLESVFNYTLQ